MLTQVSEWVRQHGLARGVPFTRSALAILALALGSACQGEIEPTPDRFDPGGGDNPVRPGAPGKPSAQMQPPGTGAPGSGPGPGNPADMSGRGGPSAVTAQPALVRLTNTQYDNTIAALLGEVGMSQSFPPDDRRLGFPYASEISPLLAGYLDTTAQTLAARAVNRLDKLLPCDPATVGEQACVSTFLKGFIARAFRRPGTADELSSYQRLFTTARAAGDFRTAVQTILEAILQSPKFLYRIEKGEPVPGKPGLRRLTGHEVASRLSFALWDSMPDDTLFAAGRDGQLATPEGIRGQFQRLLKDARARQGVVRFFEHWLEVEALENTPKDAKVYPSFTSEIRRAMARETSAFAAHALFDLEGQLSTVLTAPYSFLDPALAKFHGVALPSGTAPHRTSGDATRRAGILTQGTFLTVNAGTDESSPTLRGKFVREQLLCQSLPPPPDNVPDDGAPGSGMATKRQRLARHAADPACSGCHRLLDSVGFAFEHFDGIGRLRASDPAGPIDARGEVISAGDAGGAFDGAVALAAKLVESSEVRDCHLRQWFRFLFRRAETDGDAVSLAAAGKAFADSGYRSVALLQAMTQTDAFLYRFEGTTP